ncbi:RNA polymerase factor sigma-54 [Pseudochryseolinea flava]|uniref:RNA polymerase sigma-54 factor n=1 Tax=Pseudochryseolinea flava TaxID=2059302 RepID=A0A364Y6Q2_9BACT|nr:RNA polymerase factor sigma-54 [Pseudochryseolinea flava]RAW01778.1 RNA polymerase sigma-54 factor [Pseudochryseolinea flava]
MLYQNITQKQQLKIHPQQLQMLHLFHLNTIELEQRIQNELEDNPLIEQNTDPDLATSKNDKEDIQDYQDWDEFAYDDSPSYHAKYSQQEQMPEKPIVESIDFRTEALTQLSWLQLPVDEAELAEFIIHSLNEEGFLEGNAETVADDYSMKRLKIVDAVMVDKVIKLVQSFEPVGLAATSIQECLAIQLKRMDTKRPDVKYAIRFMEEFYQDLKARNFNRIMDVLNIDEEDIKIILDLLGTLKLKPVPKGDSTPVQYDTIIPDFIVTQEDETLHVSLYKEKASSLKISNSWKAKVKNMEKGQGTGDQATSKYLSNKLNAAEWFVNAIKQRESTMLKVMKAIVKVQFDYFNTGDELQIKPMILKNIADMVGVDISTVSRITCNKYVQTPSGNVLIKNLFNEGIANQEGVAVSVRKVQETIQQVIQEEDKTSPYSDQQIAELLARKGFKIARRTVAKYRDELRIPAAQMRWNTIHHRSAAA